MNLISKIDGVGQTVYCITLSNGEFEVIRFPAKESFGRFQDFGAAANFAANKVLADILAEYGPESDPEEVRREMAEYARTYQPESLVILKSAGWRL